MNSHFLKLILSLLPLMLIFSCVSVFSETKSPDFYSVDWNEKNTQLTLPEPFVDLALSIRKSKDKIEEVAIVKNGNKIFFKKELLDGVFDLSEPSFTYNQSDFNKDEKISYFQIYFEYGKSKLVNLGNDVPGCSSPCTELVRDIVIFTVDTEYKITREFKHFDSDL